MSTVPARARGFTLVEMLVVVTMLAILSVSIVLSLRSTSESPLAVEAERLQRLLALALEESRITGTAVLWTPTADAYRFAIATDNNADTGFPSIALDERLRARKLPDGIRIAAISIDANRQELGTAVSLSGSAPPAFSIALRTATDEMSILGSVTGKVTLKSIGGGG